MYYNSYIKNKAAKKQLYFKEHITIFTILQHPVERLMPLPWPAYLGSNT